MTESQYEKRGDGATQRLGGKVAVVTGGASGIGAATVRRFVAHGARVLIADLQGEKAQALAAELGSAAAARRVDVRREDQVRDAIGAAHERWGRLDCLFNNAGFGGAIGPLEETAVEDYDLTFDVLLKGVFLGIKHAASHMKRQGSGSIISTASVAGLRAGIGPHLYGVAKAGVIFLTQTAALELAEHRVRVNCICPGFITTPLGTGKGLEATADHFERFRRRYAGAQPLGRTGEPEDIANAALWLASEESSFVTGQALRVDGGLLTGTPWREQGARFTQSAPISLYRPGDD